MEFITKQVQAVPLEGELSKILCVCTNLVDRRAVCSTDFVFLKSKKYSGQKIPRDRGGTLGRPCQSLCLVGFGSLLMKGDHLLTVPTHRLKKLALGETVEGPHRVCSSSISSKHCFHFSLLQFLPS